MFAFNETGAQLLYSNRQSAAIFDMHTGTHRELAGHHHDRYGEAGIEGIALSADGQLAILGSRDNTLSVWDAASGVWLRSLQGHTNQVQCVITYAMGDKQYALSGSYDNTLKHWDLATGACLQTLAGHTGIIVEIDITEDRRRVVSASFDNTARVWDLASGACLQTLTGHKNVVRGVTIHPDGRRAISASADTTLKMWDMTTGQCLHTFEGHTADVYGSAVSADGRQLISVGRDGAFQWDLHRHVWVLHFDGRADYVDLGPLYLNCGQGFSAELQICLETLEHEQAVFSLGNGDDGGNISLTVDGRGELVFAVEDHGTVNQIETDGSMPLSTGQWYTVSLAVDSAGAAVFHVNGQNAGEGLTPVPRTCLRLHNEVGRSNRSRSAHLHGKVGMLRLWNRALTPDEIQKFHQRPRATPKAPLPVYHRSVLEYRNGRPYLMSGMSNGSTPPIAMFELAVDKGLAVQSKSTTAHAKLLAAQHKKQAADEKAAADRANARLAAQATVNAAHAQNQADHAHAQHRLDTAHADAAQQRAEAHQRLTVTTQRAQQQVNDARAGARRQKTDAEQRAERIKDDGYRKADRIKRNANQNLQNAQAEKAKYE
jgi:WD40 repeat protein